MFESGQGAGLIPVPQVIPGQVQTMFQPLGVADLFAQGVATTNSVRYVNEGTATNSAAAVAEGGTKPASDLALPTSDEAVRKIATVLTTSDELLDDVQALTNYVTNRLSLFCRIEEDRQLLRGGAANEVVGLVNRGVGTVGKAATDDNATFLLKAITSTYGSSFLAPDAIVMHPTNWLNTRLLRDGAGGTAGQFLSGGPFTGAYGNAGAASPALFGGSIWGIPVFLTTTIGLGRRSSARSSRARNCGQGVVSASR